MLRNCYEIVHEEMEIFILKQSNPGVGENIRVFVEGPRTGSYAIQVIRLVFRIKETKQKV